MHATRVHVNALFILLCFLSLILAVSVVQASPGWGWSILYRLDKEKYLPGSSGTVSFSLTNTGDLRLRVTKVGIQFDWQMAENKWWARSTDAVVYPGQQIDLGTVNFDVPSTIVAGTHRFRVGVEQSHLESYYDPYTGLLYTRWVSDGVRYADKYGEVLVEELKAVLTIVSVTGLPPLTRPIYVGEKSTTIVVISNTGNAGARAVKVVLEDLHPSTGLVVTASDAPQNIEPGATGQWKIEVHSQQPGEYSGMLRVYAGNERISEQAWRLKVAAPEISIIKREMSVQGAQAYLGDVVTVTYRLRNLSPVDAKSLTFKVDTGGSLTVIELPTVAEIGSQSEVTTTLRMKAERTGVAAVRFEILAYGTPVQQDNFSLSISERPFWLESWFPPLLGAVAAVIGVALVVYKRRAPKAPMVTLGEPRAPTGPSTICPRCGSRLTYVQARSKYYCTRCKEYV